MGQTRRNRNKARAFRPARLTGTAAVLLLLLIALLAAGGYAAGPSGEKIGTKREAFAEETQGETQWEIQPEDILPEREQEPEEPAGLIVLDAGHQASPDAEKEPIGPGASATKPKVAAGTAGVSTGVREYELTLQITLLLGQELSQRGYEVILVRDSNDVNISNAQRAKIANEAGADAFLRIHANGSESSETNGAMTICSTASSPYPVAAVYEESKRLSECVLDAYVESTGCQRERVLESDSYSGINWCEVPVTIVEMGYMTNPEEDRKMQDPDYQKRMVDGIADGIDRYFGKEQA